MDLARRTGRLLGLLLVAALPPLIAFAAVVTLAPDWVSATGTGTMLGLVTLAALLWATGVATIGSRYFAGDVREVVELAERGGSRRAEPTDRETEVGMLTAAERRVTAALDERNRQIAILAEQFGATPITASPVGTATHLVSVTRQLTGDPTWQLAIVRSQDETLPTGVYDENAERSPAPLTDFHRWAAVAEREGDGHGEGEPGARLAVGPWGRFVVVNLAAGDLAGGVLAAPWEGRTEPSPAELNLFSLIGRHAGTAVEHALLYGRLRDQADELNRLAKIQADFLRSVTHDLQTPLTTIRALSAEIRAAAELPAQAAADLAIVEEQADRLRRMVGQLLIASRIEAGAVQPRQEIVRWEPIIERTWRALHAAAHRLEVTADPVAVIGDSDRLEQVLWALLDNAVKYSEPGTQITVAVRARPRGELDAGLVADAQTSELVAELSVADSGIGIPLELRDQVFEQFFRGGAARDRVPDGSGIGLYAVRGLISAMGGTVRVEDSPGGGTTVVVSLPGESIEEPEAPGRLEKGTRDVPSLRP